MHSLLGGGRWSKARVTRLHIHTPCLRRGRGAACVRRRQRRWQRATATVKLNEFLLIVTFVTYSECAPLSVIDCQLPIIFLGILQKKQSMPSALGMPTMKNWELTALQARRDALGTPASNLTLSIASAREGGIVVSQPDRNHMKANKKHVVCIGLKNKLCRRALNII